MGAPHCSYHHPSNPQQPIQQPYVKRTSEPNPIMPLWTKSMGFRNESNPYEFHEIFPRKPRFPKKIPKKTIQKKQDPEWRVKSRGVFSASNVQVTGRRGYDVKVLQCGPSWLGKYFRCTKVPNVGDKYEWLVFSILVDGIPWYTMVYLPLWKIWVRQLGWWNSQLNGKS